MNTTLSFRRESIQQASATSAMLNPPAGGSAEGQGSNHGGKWMPPPTLTTSFTTL